MYKKKGFNKKNLFSKQDESDEDEFVVIKKKSTKNMRHHKERDDESDQESNYVGSKETLFMEFTNDDDSELEAERNMDSLLMNSIEEIENLQKKIISLKIEREEAKIREDFLNIKLKEKDDICEKRISTK